MATAVKKKKWQGLIFILLGILGVTLIIIGELKFGNTDNKTTDDTETIFAYSSDLQEYINELENKIENITVAVTGSEDVSALVGISSGFSYNYLKNTVVQADGVTETEYITVKNSDGSTYTVTESSTLPVIIGVSVSCRGGDTPEIQKKLTDVICAALGIPSNRICIVGNK